MEYTCKCLQAHSNAVKSKELTQTEKIECENKMNTRVARNV